MDAQRMPKGTRSRSPEKKAAQFERILDAGMDLFLEKGREGFSLRGLAKNLGMNQNNLYNYVDSKRELWLAIRQKFMKQYRDENIEIIKNHKGSTVELLLKIFEHFFEFAEREPRAFQMIHITPSPSSDKIGKFEKTYRPFNFLDGTTQVIQDAINKGEIKETNASIFSFFLYSVILGAAIVGHSMRYREKNYLNHKTDVEELSQFGSQNFSWKELRNYVLKKIEFELKDSNMAIEEKDYRIDKQ